MTKISPLLGLHPRIHRVGVIHGRFQPLHLGHMEYLLAGKNRCDYLVVGVTNPDPDLTKDHESNPSRSQTLSNPLTYFERLHIIRASLVEAGIPEHEFCVVPFPINMPERIQFYAPLNATYYVTVYDEWGQSKVKILENQGCKVDIMWNRSNETRITSGTEVRSLIRASKPWRHLVPNAAWNLMNEFQIPQRMILADQKSC